MALVFAGLQVLLPLEMLQLLKLLITCCIVGGEVERGLFVWWIVEVGVVKVSVVENVVVEVAVVVGVEVVVVVVVVVVVAVVGAIIVGVEVVEE